MSHDDKRYEIDRILTQPDRGITETRGIGGILARLWRTILSDLNMQPGQFELLLSDFITNARRKIPDNRVSKLFTRGNLRREFEKPTMTFKVFMKGMKLLKVRKLRLAVELEFSTKRKTLHQVSVDLGDQQHGEDLFNAQDESETQSH